MKFSNQWSPVFFPTQDQPSVFRKLEMIMNVLATNSRKRLRSRVRNSGDGLFHLWAGSASLRKRAHVLADEGSIYETPHSYTIFDRGLRQHRIRSHISSRSNANV